MLNFRKLTPADRSVLQPYFRSAGMRGCEDSFSCIYLWSDQQVTFVDGIPLIVRMGYGDRRSYALPLAGDRAALIELLRRDAHENGTALHIFSLLREDLPFFEEHFGGQFTLYPTRDAYDYIYEIDRLCELRGKHLQSKRNFCNRFEATHPNFRILPLTKELLPRCAEFAALWYANHGDSGVDYGGEQTAFARASADFDALGFEGILLEEDGRTLGFAMGSRMSETVYDIHFEKALAEVPGAYPMINREFARLLRARYPELKYINREDDMGIEGLRNAKESYHPEILLEKWFAVENYEI